MGGNNKQQFPEIYVMWTRVNNMNKPLENEKWALITFSFFGESVVSACVIARLNSCEYEIDFLKTAIFSLTSACLRQKFNHEVS